MPYSLRGDCVYKGDTKLKCYDNHADALAYFRALKINVKTSLAELSMYISKASSQDGSMRWQAVNSDTSPDLYNERMSLELYKSMLGYIKSGTPPPEPYRSRVCSDYWCGGMPYLSIAHYPDLGGMAVPGEPFELYIEGDKLKAKGVLYDSKLGQAVWKSLKLDEQKPNDDKIRISIAFLDLAHKHGDNGETYKRLSTDQPCKECMTGVGDKIYLDGYLVHLALTRVPVNTRTIMELRSMAKKTRKDDALSIVGDEDVVKAIETQAAIENKSDILVEMSDADDEEVVVEDSAMMDKKKKDTKMTPEDESAMVDTMDAEDNPEKDVNTKKKVKKSLTEEDVVELVKSLLPKSDTVSSEPVAEKSALDKTVNDLFDVVDKAVRMDADLNTKLDTITPVMQNLGSQISEIVKSSVSTARVVADNVDVPTKLILEKIGQLGDTITALTNDVALMKSQTATPQQANDNTPRVPRPRSLAPDTVRSVVEKAMQIDKPLSVHELSRRSVGLE